MHLRELDANLIVVLDALLVDGSVTKAAARLGRSPSAISHALTKLRDIFSDELLVRTGQKLTPTAKALRLAPAVHVVVAGIESLLRPAAPFDARSQRRAFTLTCRDVTELTLLRSLRNTLKEAAPGISMHWRMLLGRQFVEDLRGGRAQFVILDGSVADLPNDISWTPLFDETYVTLVRRGHPFAEGQPSAEEFFKAPHILVTRAHEIGDPVRDHFASLHIAPSEVMEVSSAFAGLFMAMESDGVITVPAPVATTIASLLPLVPVEQPFPPLIVANSLGWHRSQDRDECHEWIRQLTETVAAAE